MADLARKTASIYIDHTAAEQALEKLQKQADKLSASIKKGEAAGKDMTKQIALLGDTNKQIAALEKQIDSGLKPSFNQLQNLVSKTRAELKKMSESDPGFAAKAQELKKYSSEMNSLGDKIGLVRKQNGGLANSIGGVIKSYLGFTAIIGTISKIVSGSIELSDQLGDLRRVVGLTADEANKLNHELLQIDTRTSGAGLLSIAIIAGKLGVAKGDIVSFTTAVDKLVITLGDELGGADEITTQLGKILNVFDGKITGDNISYLGNAIVDLANKGVATGGFIVDFTQRVSGIAKASNLSLASTLGLAAGFESLGLRSESSATALQTLLTTIGKDVPKAAKIAGVPLKEFNALFAEKPEQALIKYAEGLVKNKKSFAEITTSFADADAKGARIVQTLQAIAQNSGYLKEQIDTANVSIKEQNALNDGAAIKQENLAGSIAKLGKAWDRLIANSKVQTFLSGIVDEISGVTTALDKMANAGFAKTFDRVGEGLKTLLRDGPKGLAQLNAQRKAAEDYLAAFHEGQSKQGQVVPEGTKGALNFLLPTDTTPGKKPITSNNSPTISDEERKKAEQELKESLSRADRFRKQALDAIAKANEQEIQLLKDKYIGEADDQTKSLAERFAAITAYNDAGLKLIMATTAGQQDSLDNEIATAKKNAKSKEELAAIEELRIAKQADIAKQNALSVSNFKIEVSKKYTEVQEQGFKKQTDLIDKNYQHQKEIADQLAKDQLNNVSINTDNQLLALDKAFQDGKIKNLEDYQNRRDAIVRAGNQKEQQEQLKHLETIQGFLQFYGIKSTDFEKKIADLKVKINEDGHKKKEDDDQKAFEKRQEFNQFIIDSVQQVANIISTINSAKNAEDEAQLDENKKRLDDNTKKLDRELAKNLISQKEYDRQLKALQDKKDKEDEAIKKKQFQRDKQAQIIQAIMSGAQAIVSTLAARPGFTDIISLGAFRAINIALAVATTAAQVATISSQKFAKGGVFDGPSHSDGGMPVINPRTGKKVAEMEGGEPILSKKTYANNKELVDQLLRASMYGNGARITPYWQQRSDYKQINYSGVSRSIERVNYFANGGIFTASGANNQQDNSSKVLIEAINRFESAVSVIQDSANLIHENAGKPITVKAYTLLSDANAQQELYDRIKRETTIKR